MTTPSAQLIPEPKRRALRELNANHHDIVTALNQTQTSLTRLSRLVEDSYQRKRKQIINGHDDEESI
jgi:hypothetical protein